MFNLCLRAFPHISAVVSNDICIVIFHILFLSCTVIWYLALFSHSFVDTWRLFIWNIFFAWFHFIEYNTRFVWQSWILSISYSLVLIFKANILKIDAQFYDAQIFILLFLLVVFFLSIYSRGFCWKVKLKTWHRMRGKIISSNMEIAKYAETIKHTRLIYITSHTSMRWIQNK